MNDNDGDDSLGRAANRYVTFQIVSAIIGGIIFLVFLFAFFLPMFNRMGPSSNAITTQGPQEVAPQPGTATMTIDGHPATPEEQRALEQQINKPQPANPPIPPAGGSTR